LEPRSAIPDLPPDPVADFPLGDRIVRPHLNRIDGPGGSMPVEPRVMEVLVCLAGHRGRVVSKEELVREVWGGRFVSDDVVWRSIGELRRALGDDSRSPTFIRTVPKRGYLLAAVENGHGSPTPAPEAPAPPPAARRIWPLLGLLFVFGLTAAWLVGRHGAPSPSPAPGSPLARSSSASPEAHDTYLKGLYFLNRGTPEDLPKSLEAFERAVVLDPGNARAHAGAADATHLLILFGRLPAREAYPRAEASAREALRLDDSLADTHATLGSIFFRYHWDWPAAEKELRRAVALNPASATAHHDYAWFLVAQGRFDEALGEIQRAQALDPLSPRANADVGWVYYRAGRWPEAIRQMKLTLELEPGFTSARHCLEGALARQGRLVEAVAQAREALIFEGASPEEMRNLTTGDPAAALRNVEAWRLGRMERRARNGRVSPYSLAAKHAALGEADLVFQKLEKAFADRDPSLASVAVDPAFSDLRADPRFQDLLWRIGLRR
jgi:DNA-binding winged helix-turn-helix (wHTH) protein/tetratricopeptide (TPR) repeat protein